MVHMAASFQDIDTGSISGREAHRVGEEENEVRLAGTRDTNWLSKVMDNPVLCLAESRKRPWSLRPYNIATSLPTVEHIGALIRDWTNYLAQGRRIGGGRFADVYLGRWVNISPPSPISELGPMGSIPKVVIKVFRPVLKDAVARDRAKVGMISSHSCPYLRI